MKKKIKENQSVSIVMCTYNGSLYLEAQLQSVLEQTYPIHELVIYDDASTDDTWNILSRYAYLYPQIKLCRNKQNVGLAKNFEQALLAASGEVIGICDQDDIWALDKVEKQMLAWRSDVILIYCYSYIFQGQIPINSWPDKRMRKFEGVDGRKMSLYNTVSGHACLFRRELLTKALPFSEEIIYDWWLGMVAAYNGGVQYLPEVLVYQRAHQSNQTLGDHLLTPQQIRDKRKREIVTYNQRFATIPNLPLRHQRFFQRLSVLAQQSMAHSFYLPLFWFLFQNQCLVFHPHRLPYPVISQAQLSYRRTVS